MPDFIQLVDDLLHPKDVERLELAGEQRRGGLAIDAIALVLEAMHLQQDGVERGGAAQMRHGLLHLRRDLRQDLCLLPHAGQGLGDPMQDEQIGRGVGVVEDVIDVGGEVVDVFAIERRDERGRQRPHDAVGGLVSLVLALLDRGCAALRIVVGRDHLQQEFRRVDDVRRGAAEQLEEALLAGDDLEPSHRLLSFPAAFPSDGGRTAGERRADDTFRR